MTPKIKEMIKEYSTLKALACFDLIKRPNGISKNVFEKMRQNFKEELERW